MPLTVPSYDDTKVAPQGAPNVALAAPQNDLARVGAELGQAGAGAGDIAIKAQEQRNADRILQAEGAMRSDYLTFENQLQQRKGQDAWGVTNDVASWFDKSGKTYADGLENDAQRRLFQPSLMKLRETALSSAGAYERQQREVSLEQSAKASIASLADTAAANYDNANAVASAKKDTLARVSVQAGFNGWSPERKDFEESVALTNLHKQVLQAMVQNSPDKAKEYYDANKGEIAGASQAELEKMIETGSVRVQSQQAMVKLMATGGTEAETLKAARENYTGQLQDAVIERVHQQFDEREQVDQRYKRDLADQGWSAFIKGSNSVEGIPTDLLTKLQNDNPQALKAMEATQRAERVQTDWVTYSMLKGQALNDFSGFKKVDLRDYSDRLAPGNMKELIDLQSKPAIPPDVLTREAQLKEAHTKLGWVKNDKSTLEKIGQFDSVVNTALTDAQHAKGERPLTQAERQQVIDRAMIQGTVQGGGWFGLWDSGARAYQVAGTPNADKFQATVPDEEAVKITAAFAAHGIKPTPELIRQAYLQKKGM